MRRPPGWLWQGVSLFLGLKLAVALLNLRCFPTLRRAAPSPLAGRVSILVPARDEARTLPHTLPGLLAQPAAEVLVLDDRSGDGTAELARQLGARVIAGEPLPQGWHGKPWACWQLAGAACGDFLAFTDADVRWQPGTLDALLAELERTGADLLTVWPRQTPGSPGERLLVPLVDDVLLSWLPHPLTRLPHAAASAGNGQLMLFRRAAYQRLGGHALVRGEVLEDVRLAARFKARGGRLALALGGDLLSVRMYRGYREAVLGFAKSARSVHGGSRVLLGLSWGLHLAAYTLPLLARRPLLLLLALAGRLLVLHTTGRTRPADLAELALTPLLPLAALPVYLQALRSSYRWKGRTYRVGSSEGLPGKAAGRSLRDA